MIVEYRMLVTESLGHNRAALMAALKEHNVKTAIVTYSGAGDSGDVDGVETIPQEAIKALEASKVTMRLPKGEFVDGLQVVEEFILEMPDADTANIERQRRPTLTSLTESQLRQILTERAAR